MPAFRSMQGTPLTIFDICRGSLSILAQRETVRHSFKVTREGLGEVILDLPFTSVTFTNHRKAPKSNSHNQR